MINSFSQYLVEEERVVYFTFGRMNPPTIGHGKLMDALAAKAGRNPYFIYLSQSNNTKKDPIPYKDKVKHVRKMFPKHGRQIVINKKVITPFFALSDLYSKGYRKVVMVAGSDRVQEYDLRLNKYNGKKGAHGFYNFEGGVKIVSAGQRDADAEGATGASGTKQRKYASDGNFVKFAQGLPTTMSNSDSRRLFNDVRKGLGLKEQNEFKRHIQLQPVSETREKFIEGELYDLGEQVIIKKTNEVGTISVLGSNYVIVETAERKTRQWLDAVEKIEEAARWKKAGPNGEIEINHKGQKYKIEKALDHNERHKGEFKIMVWDKRRRDWEWDNTVQGKAYAKELVMDKLDEEYKYEWGTDASTKHAKKMTPGQKNEGGMKRIATTQSNKADRMASGGKKGLETFKKKQEAQDPDIKDRKGTQPARYHTGLSKATKIARDRHFQARKPGPAPGDANAKTIPSKHTMFVRKMMGEADTRVDIAKAKIDREKEADKKKHDRMMDRARLNDTKKKNMQEYGGPPISRKDYMKKKSAGIGYNSVQEGSFEDKSKASGISVGTLKKVYQRGVAAWKTGHRPGTNPSQWGHARVNAFIRKKKQGGLNHDKDLA